MSQLAKRIITAIITIPIAFLLIYFGKLYFNIAIAMISSIALWEFYSIANKKNFPTFIIFGIVAGIFPILLFSINSIAIESSTTFDIYSYFIVFFFFFALTTLILYLFSKKENILGGICITFGGFIYVSLSFFALVVLRNFDWNNLENFGLWITILTLCSIWICDSAAFFFGRKLGKHKLMPSVSPNKSIEGAIAGFIFSALFFIFGCNYLLPEFNFWYTIIIGIVIAIVGQVGDLIESKIKRDADIKDSSNIIPGHGGVLDRFDSIMVVAPVVVIMLIIFSQ